MICPKCKNQIPEKTLKCNHCSARVAMLCKKCGAYNSIYNTKCVNCRNELLKICPGCKGVNLPNAEKCRRCGKIFIQEEEAVSKKVEIVTQDAELDVGEADRITETLLEEPLIPSAEIEPEAEIQVEHKEVEQPVREDLLNLAYNAELYSQQRAKEILVEELLAANKKVISLSGQKGVGKTIVLKTILHELKKSGIVWLLGECSAISQLSPCGLIQDILLTFFNIPNFCVDGLKLKKDSQKFFQSEFPTLTNEEIFNLLNFLYPTNSDYFENILINKEKTFTLLKKVFKTIIENNKAVFVIENFDFIDGFSYEFLHNILNSDFITKPLRFLITYDEIRPARGYLYNTKLRDDSYLDVSLSTFDRSQMNSLIDSIVEQHVPQEKCPEPFKNQIFSLASGNPAILEQYTSLLVDHMTKNNNFELEIPTSLDNAIKIRLNFLKENTQAYKALSLAAIQGIKFSPAIINQILKLEEAKLDEILVFLQKSNFIMPVNEHFYAFKNSLIWSAVFDAIKEASLEDFSTLNNSLFAVLSNYTLSSHSIMAVIAQNLRQDLSALNFWTDNIKLAAYIGDTNLYAISQKQCLMLIEKLENVDNSLIKDNIYERLGKLLSQINPKEAMEYLPNAILKAKRIENILKEIELTGYLASCCISLGNYYGTIECVNSVIAKMDDSFDLELAVLKSRKLDALLNIGNSGEIINLADNEILPVFDKYINAKPHKNISVKTLYKAWLQTYLILANALIFQGNNRSFEVISTLFEILHQNNFEDKLFICKVKLALAFANTIKGDIESSEEILEEIIKTYKTDIMDNEAISRWNLINILNNFIHKKYSGLKEELFQVVTFANNINDNFTKNILKTLLGKLFKDEENAKRALEIYSEQITYFSKEKNAIGALLSWYLIAEARLIVEGPEKALEVAQKALDVAQGPKINNYFFTAMYHKIIAESFMVQSDYEMARVHIEKAILIARKFELLDMLAGLYLLYGKYLQDIALVKTEAQIEYVQGASKMYKKAGLIAQGIKNNHLITRIEKAKAVLNSFCQLNDIILKDA